MKHLFTFALCLFGFSSFSQKIGVDSENKSYQIYKPKQYKQTQSPSLKLNDTTTIQSTVIYAEQDNMPIKVVGGTIPNMNIKQSTMPNTFEEKIRKEKELKEKKAKEKIQK